MMILITGLSAAGKTTLGDQLAKNLKDRGYRDVEFLDGEELRKRYDRVYGHSLEERFEIIDNIVRIVKECNEKGKIAIVSTISHKRKMRETFRRNIENFMEVYLKCPVPVCAARDYKGNYQRAFKDRSEYFAGITEPYEESDAPELVLDTAHWSVEKCLEILSDKASEFIENRKKN